MEYFQQLKSSFDEEIQSTDDLPKTIIIIVRMNVYQIDVWMSLH